MKLKLFLALILLLCCVGVADATILYVCTDGSCTYNCDGIDDQVEINWAIDNATAWDVIHINTSTLVSGEYNISGTIYLKDSIIFEGDGLNTILANGTDPYDIINTSYSSDIIIRNLKIIPRYSSAGCAVGVSDGGSGAITVNAGNNITIHDVEIDAIAQTNGNRAIWLVNGSTNITIYNYTAKNTRCGAIDTDPYVGGIPYSSWVNAYNLTCENIGLHAFKIKTINSVYRDFTVDGANNNGFYVYSIGTDANLTIEDFTIKDADGTGLAVFATSDVTIRDGVIYDDKVPYSKMDIGLQLTTGTNGNNTYDILVDNITIYGIYGLDEIGLLLQKSGAGYDTYFLKNVTVKNCKVYDTTTVVQVNNVENVTLNNNVIYGGAGDGIYVSSSNVLDFYVKNNIIASNSGYGINSSVSIINTYNDVWNNTKGNYNGTSAGTGDISLDPLFADPANGDFHLNSTAGRWNGTAWVTDAVDSPCIDMGDPSDDASNEPEPNRNDRINIGAYGNTAEASKSPLRCDDLHSDGVANNMITVCTESDTSCYCWCDGVDDHVEIQYAVWNATETVRILDGVYDFAGTVYVNNNDTIIEGESLNTVLRLNFSTYYIGAFNTTQMTHNITYRTFTVNASPTNDISGFIARQDVEVSDVLVENIYDTTNDNLITYGFSAGMTNRCYNLTIKDCVKENRGITFAYCTNVWVENNTITSCISTGCIDNNRNNINVTIINNTVQCTTGNYALRFHGSCNDAYVANNILDGSVYSSSNRGVIGLDSGYNLIFENNTIYSGYSGYSLETYGNLVNVTIKNDRIYDCSYGIATWYRQAYSHDINVSNVVIYGAAIDGVKVDYSGSTVSIKNSIIVNSSGYGLNRTDGILNITYCDVWNNTLGNYNGTVTGYNNISADPLFYDAGNGKFYLNSTAGTWNGTGWEIMSSNSPCIDAGDYNDSYTNEPEPNANLINIGAYGNTIYASKSPVDFVNVTPIKQNNVYTIQAIGVNPTCIFYKNATVELNTSLLYSVKASAKADLQNFTIYPETATVNVTVNEFNLDTGGQDNFTANSTTTPNNVTFTRCNLTAGQTYMVRKDGQVWLMLTANSTGCIQFTNSQWSEIIFTLIEAGYCFVWYNGTSDCTDNFTATLDSYGVGDYYSVQAIYNDNTTFKKFNETSNNASIQVNVTVCGLDASSQYKVSIYNWTTNNKVTEKVVKTNSTGCLFYTTTNVTMRYVLVEKQPAVEVNWFMIYGAIGGTVISGVLYLYRRWRKV